MRWSPRVPPVSALGVLRARAADVIDLYAAGGRGAGATSIRKSPLVRGFALTDDDRAALVAFLGTLTDDALLTDPRFADPW